MTTLSNSADHLKDEVLDTLADEFNVAQFASFAPGPVLSLRFARIRDTAERSPEAVAAILLQRSGSGSVNVRTFRPEQTQGNPFVYGVTDPRQLLQTIQALTREGYYVIVNETIDINDGGVSGVRGGGITEFAPRATPRVVEEPDVCSVEDTLADGIFATVYRAEPPFPADRRVRVEFSIHPTAVGFRREPWIIWEVATLQSPSLKPNLHWPNRFSRHIGDKAFGLLIAHLVGLPVPRSLVLARDVAPFCFGTDTRSRDQWIRTCPREFSPGEFPTVHGWADPFEMLASADPTGERIASVLVQQAVEALWSGAARADGEGLSVEGVPGPGDNFMLGMHPPAVLPSDVVQNVSALVSEGQSRFGSVRAEWALDAQRPWLVQLNAIRATSDIDINPGNAVEWRAYNPERGLDELRTMIEDAAHDGAGIQVTRPIGLTSHIGDLLRASGIAARFASAPVNNDMS